MTAKKFMTTTKKFMTTTKKIHDYNYRKKSNTRIIFFKDALH